MRLIRWVYVAAACCAMATNSWASVVLGPAAKIYIQVFQVADYPGATFANLINVVTSDFDPTELGSARIFSNDPVNGQGSGSGLHDDSIVFESVNISSATTFTVFFSANPGSEFTLDSYQLRVGNRAGSQVFTVIPGLVDSSSVPEPSSLLLVLAACMGVAGVSRSIATRRQAKPALNC